jgi:hypothetical protein
VSHFDLPITHPPKKKHKLKLGHFLKVAILCQDRAVAFCLAYLGEKGKTLGKGYGIK